MNQMRDSECEIVRITRANMLKIKMYPAGNGDAFLISAAGKNILIDGGYAQTFNEHIVHDLRNISTKGEHLDLLIASHIDADHISGLIQFLSVNGSSSAPKIVPIGAIWHNSLKCLTAQNHNKPQSADQTILDALCRRGHLQHSVGGATEISARQGSSFASLIYSGGYQWNGHDGTASISVGSAPVIDMPGGHISVIAPSQERLDGLLKWWRRELRKLGYRGSMGADDIIDDAFEFMCEHSGDSSVSQPSLLSAGYKSLNEAYDPDTSITNGSSIATIVELGGVRVLMLADAWAEDLVQTLRSLQSQGCSMIFDAIKISHHGSLRNTSPELLQLVDAPRYFVSSNGAKHDHPDIEVLTAIIDRPAPFPRTLYFNYSTTASNLLRNYCSKSNTPFYIHDNATDWIEIQ